MIDIYEKLEFTKIKTALKKYVHTEIASSRVMNLTMLEKEDLLDELTELNETYRFVSKYTPINIGHHKNLMPVLAMLIKGTSAPIEFFVSLSDLLANIKDILKYRVKDETFTILNKYIDTLKPLDSLKNKIDSVISPDMSIFDNASSHLYSIRSAIRKEESSQGKILSSLMNKYRNYLNDERMALKDQGLTLPVKISYKNRVEGVVLDISTSGILS